MGLVGPPRSECPVPENGRERAAPGHRWASLPTLLEATSPGPTYGDLGIAPVMTSEALFAASCNDFVERCA